MAETKQIKSCGCAIERDNALSAKREVILFLGPACPPIEAYFAEEGHTVLRTAVKQVGPGSFHYAKDKLPYLYLYEKSGFDTPVCEIITNLKEHSFPKQI